ncbi:MAG: LysE family transporter [Phycisphaerae bacterium]|nr:LysE family transporter [Phycisphaerae bacterium]MDD5381108.1 LysE family transporter [Phycisphaerae bacterium]
MAADIFLKGLIVGFLVATPVGPVGLLCIQRTLSEGKMHGLVSGLGAATADAIYGLIAALGLTVISTFLVEKQLWIRLFGGLFLCYLGIKTFLSKSAGQGSSANVPTHIGNYGSTFLLAITSPVTILVFAAVFAGLGTLTSSARYISVGLSVAGVFTGSALWWVMLCGIAGILHGKISLDKLTMFNKVSGIIITAFGLVILLLIVL